MLQPIYSPSVPLTYSIQRNLPLDLSVLSDENAIFQQLAILYAQVILHEDAVVIESKYVIQLVALKLGR